MRLAWIFREVLIKLLGRDLANRIIGTLILRLGTYLITKSYCSIFPFREIVESPDFDRAVKDAVEKYRKTLPDTKVDIPGWDKWVNLSPHP